MSSLVRFVEVCRGWVALLSWGQNLTINSSKESAHCVLVDWSGHDD